LLFINPQREVEQQKKLTILFVWFKASGDFELLSIGDDGQGEFVKHKLDLNTKYGLAILIAIIS
jgi:hypothetical protein